MMRGQSGKALYLRNCASVTGTIGKARRRSCHRLIGIGERKSRAEIVAVIQKGSGRDARLQQPAASALNAIVQYVLTGEDVPTDAPVTRPPTRSIASPAIPSFSTRTATRRSRHRGAR